MKNVYYLFLVLAGLLCSMSVSAKKVLYSQNFETVTGVAETGWASPSAAAGLSIGSDDNGKFLRFVPSGNDRSAHLYWDESLIKNELSADFTSYQITFGFCFNKFGNNHMTSEIAVMSEESIAKKKPNGNYRTNNNGALFDLTQLSNTGRSASATGDQDFAINGDSTNYKALTAGTYYTVTLDIDTLARTVQYTIKSATSDDPIASDIYTVPEGIDMTATGLYVLGGRYTPDIMFDDIEVSVDKTAANTPSVTLTGINNAQRVYTIKFQEDEILHLDFNGTTTDVNYADVDNGTYTWSNNPNYDPNNTDKAVTDACESGTLKAWTTLDNMKSEVVETEVDNNIIALPAATAEVSNVSVGYGKTYSVTCDNSNTPLSPAIYGTYKFTGKDGKVTSSTEAKAFPFTIDVDQAGTLEITSQAFGYGSTNTTVENNVEYEVKKTIDLAHMTEADITAAGYEKGDDVTGKFVDYGRFYGLSTTETETAADGTTSPKKIVYNAIPQFTKKASAFTDANVIGGLVACGSDGKQTDAAAILPVNANIYQGIGLVLDGRKGDDGAGSWINDWFFKVEGATANDIVTVASVNNYGSSSLHPSVASLDEYLAQDNAPVTKVLKGDEPFSLYRISDALGKVTVYSAKGGATGIKTINNNTQVVNAPIYSISGVRMNKDRHSLPKGIYIQGGKKFVVK
jgi:hypothetical protein